MTQNIKAEWKINKGKAFENLVGDILKCMFPDITFEQTNYVHDGGKDFYSVGNNHEEKIWIEAKNYNDHLELSKFSNTFIMADISEINHILLFSMSEITLGAKINIARYAAYHNKTISVYAGNDILVLLKEYKEKVDVEQYIENVEELLKIAVLPSSPSNQKLKITSDYYHAKQFNLAYRRDRNSHIKKNELKNLPLHSLIAQEILISNNDLFQSKTIFTDCSEYDATYIESYFYKEKPEKLQIPPASTKLIVIFFKITDIYSEIKLPTITIQNCNIDMEMDSLNTQCSWLGEIPYIGKSWETLQNTIQLLKSNPSKKIGIVKGKSGVGKSRFLQELAGYYFQNGYRIISLDFRSMTDISIKNVLRDILGNIYVLDSNKDDSDTYINEFGELYKDFYDILFNDDYNCNIHIDRICYLLLSLFNRKQILLVADNVQDVGNESSSFFETLIRTLNNHTDFSTFVILCFNEDFLSNEKASVKLLRYLEQLPGSCCVKLNNFTEQDALLYLKECLDPRGLRSDLYSYFNVIIKRFGTNPFLLKQLMLYLKQRNVLVFCDSVICVSDYNAMKIALSELPPEINNILQYRYTYLLHNTKLNDANTLNQIIWSILFLGSLKPSVISAISFDFRAIEALLNFGFIEYDAKSELVFCHQLIEQSFCLFFMKTQYAPHPALVFIEDKKFLTTLFHITNEIGKINLCIENMLLRSQLNEIDVDTFNMALKRLINTMPRAIMIPMIIQAIEKYLNLGIKANPHYEFQSLYAISISCQEKFDVRTAAEQTKDLVVYEQETYREKLTAKEDIIQFFKNYVFQLTISEKNTFLDWILNEIKYFELADYDYHNFLGWLHNRYCKNLASEHRFEEAKTHIEEALKIALSIDNYCAAAEAEIEYGNIFAYDDASKTVEHWRKSVEYISKCSVNSVYFRVYKHGYYVLSQLLDNKWSIQLQKNIQKLLNLREKTFLYQKLFIDDVCADYYIIQYLDNEPKTEILEKAITQLYKMKSDSYMHSSSFTILATYKLFVAYLLLCEVNTTPENLEIATSLIFELCKNDLFQETHLTYSQVMLHDIVYFCQRHHLSNKFVMSELPEEAKKLFRTMMTDMKQNNLFALTPLSNKTRKVNLLFFNYVL